MSRKLIFIDWDDTLFPTDWIHTTDAVLNNPTTELISMFHNLDVLVTDMILKMMFLGDVLVVTNGSNGWINQCLNVLPTFKELIDHGAIKITSARDLFELEHDKEQWKRLTFKMFFNEHISDTKGDHHILSFGDSTDEHEAVLELKSYNVVQDQNRIVKSIRFKKYPDLNQLVSQLETVRMLYEDIIHKNEDHIFNLEEFIL
jgi:hypothetical protein